MQTAWIRWIFLIALVAAACDVKKVGEQGSASEVNLSGPMTGVYKYTDNKGVVHYVDDINKVPPKYREKATHPTGGAVSIVPSSSIDEVLLKHGITEKQFRRYLRKEPGKKSGGGSHGDVIIYTTSWCPACTRARKYLSGKGVSFTEKDVERSKGDLQEMLKKSGGARGVPVIDIHGKILRGFNSRAIDKALGS